jgi:hypothetical protein
MSANIGIIGGVAGTITLGDDPTEHTVYGLTALETLEADTLADGSAASVRRLIEIVSRIVPTLADRVHLMNYVQLAAIYREASRVNDIEALFPNGSSPTPATGSG